MKISLNDAYFGIKLFEGSFTDRKKRELKTYNLFDSSSVKWSVAKYVTMTDKEKGQLLCKDPLAFCFGDVWRRSEYEFMISPCPYHDGDKIEDYGHKIDVFEMYVRPNEEILMDIVYRISKTSAIEYISEWQKHREK